ncbi:MAG: hypothetical protein H7832_05540 [Magnetococcus sp. DMHC-6]
MVNLIVSLIFAILLLIFSSQNMHEIHVRFVIGDPVKMPMILVLAGAFMSGFLLAVYHVHVSEK